MRRQLSAILQQARYAKLVQGIDVSGVEEQARTVIAAVDHLRESLAVDVLRDGEQAETQVLQPLCTLSGQALAVTEAIQHALQKRAPEGAEAELLRLLRAATVNGTADLYSVIMTDSTAAMRLLTLNR